MSKWYPCIYCTEDLRCEKYSGDGVISFCVLGPCSDERPSNADRIRAMSDEELADWYFDKFFPCVPYCSMLQDGCPEHDDCKICLLEWLKQAAEEDKDAD